jgi:hypothetical protein
VTTLRDLSRLLVKQSDVRQVVGFFEEYALPSAAALGDVMWNVWNHDSGDSRQGSLLLVA